MGDRRHAYKVSVGSPAVKRSLGRARRRWKYNIKWYFEER
jgi:hypothetical protein